MQAQDLIEMIAEGLANGEYSLFLGAGASLGSTGGNGRLLPTGIGLRDALVEEFKIDTEGESIALAQVYSYLQLHHGPQANEFLRNWFTECGPSWQQIFAEFSWKRIWTLNIDDVVEQAFKEVGRPLWSLTWNQRFSDRNSGTDQQIIHLHGKAQNLTERAGDDGIIVFSLSEYAREIANPRTWHKVFQDELASKPFLVVGAQLTEEIDLIEALERGSTARASTGFPSILVVPAVSQIRRTQIESYGFVVVESDGETFLRQLLMQYRETISNRVGLSGPATPGLMKFQQQFIELRTFTPASINAEDFYSGYHPTWNTIRSNDDAKLDKTDEASAEILSLATSEQIFQTIVFLTGNPGSGKSTALLRIADSLIGAGTHPYLFRADEYMDVEATVEWLKAVPRTVLLFDDFADHSMTLQRLADRCSSDNVRMLLIASDRPSRRQMISHLIEEKYLNLSKSYWYGKLSDEDIDRVLEKLHARGRLGHITRRNSQDQHRYFRESAERSLFDAMADLEGGPGFKDRMKKIYDTLPTMGLKNLYTAACLCYDQSIPLPAGIGANFAGVAPRELANLIEDQCRGILVLTRTGIRPPHRMTANLMRNALPRGVRSETSLALAKTLAPHIDEGAMRSGTREYRIVRHLMHHETVMRDTGEHDARKWYEELRQYYDWNGRYWDQRALLESAYGQHEIARSYAERSIEVHRHSFGFNTLGTVLLRMAIRNGSVRALSEGIENLEVTKSFQEWGDREHPFTTFFTSLIRYGSEWGFAEIPPIIRNTWFDWFREAQSSTVYTTAKGQEQLNNWQRQWLRLANAPKSSIE